MVTRGYPSISFLYSAAEAIMEVDKPAFIYYFGDYDPSGCDISRTVESGLRELAPDAEIHFERVAVTPEQIARWNLPTRPTKTTDTRSKRFHGESVELDAVEPGTLRDLVRRCIVQHIDRYQWKQSLAIERQEREVLGRILSNLGSDYGRDATR
jgi:hypothetical protein